MEANTKTMVQDVLAELACIRDSMEDSEPVDVRVQIDEGQCFVHYGDAGFDTDHSGYWGASSVSRDDSDADLHTLACVMIEEALDTQACDAESTRPTPAQEAQ